MASLAYRMVCLASLVGLAPKVEISFFFPFRASRVESDGWLVESRFGLGTGTGTESEKTQPSPIAKFNLDSITPEE